MSSCWAKYILNKSVKTIEVNNCKYYFNQNEWIEITNPFLKRKINKHPSVFDVAEFDIDMLKGISNIKCHGKLVYTSNKEAIKKLNKSPYFLLKIKNNEQHVYSVIVCDGKFRLINLFNEKSGTVAIYRMKGGWGDIIMSFSAAKALKKQYPHLTVIYSCPDTFRELVDGDKDVSWQDLNDLMKAKYDVYINLTSPCIKYEIANQPNVKKNRTEIFCSESEINYNKFFSLEQVVHKEEISKAKCFLKKINSEYKKKIVIGFLPVSCAPIRNWGGFETVSRECFEKYNSTNLIFNADVNFKWNGHNNDVKIFGYSMKEVVAMLSLCDLVIGVDTGPMHSASALKVPTLWIFTHIDGKIRTKDYPNANIIQDNSCEYSPCWYDKNCEDGKESKCGKAISIDMVMKKTGEILNHGNNILSQCRSAS